MIRKAQAPLVALLLILACSSSGPSETPNQKEWALLSADYQWILNLRQAQKPVPGNASRREQIEVLIENHKKLAPTYDVFIDKIHAYYDRTADPRAAAILVREKVILGDEYMSVLSRYDKAIALYREALEFDPTSSVVLKRIETAQQKRFVSMSAFATLKQGMSEQDVRAAIGYPREDWIKQVVQNNRVYSVWIYPKADGGASAVYFDNGVVYHTNWNAAAPSAGAAPQQ